MIVCNSLVILLNRYVFVGTAKVLCCSSYFLHELICSFYPGTRYYYSEVSEMGTDFQSTLNSMIAGAGAGAICTVVCAPLDVLKVRLQVQGQLGLNQYSDSLFRNTFQIFRDEGIRG
eukprot:gene29313-38840_t